MNSMFLGCDSIKSINFTNFKTSLVTDMSNMFQGCTNLKSLDLSSFDTSMVTDMSNMFSNCDSLEYLYINNFNTENLKKATNMFSNNLKYLDISKITENEIIKDELSSLNSTKNLLICQKNDIIQNVNSACCESKAFITGNKKNVNNNKEMCTTNNYIIVKYGKKADYLKGFGNQYRDGVVFIVLKGKNKYNDKLYQKNEALTLNPNDIIEIHFGYPVKSLVSFFGYERSSKSGDENVEKIVSIDLSNFDSSLINDISAMFQ